MGVRISLTLPRYRICRKAFGSKEPLTNKEVLNYLNRSCGLKEEIVSFSVEGTKIVYPPLQPSQKEKKNVSMGNPRKRKVEANKKRS